MTPRDTRSRARAEAGSRVIGRCGDQRQGPAGNAFWLLALPPLLCGSSRCEVRCANAGGSGWRGEEEAWEAKAIRADKGVAEDAVARAVGVGPMSPTSGCGWLESSAEAMFWVSRQLVCGERTSAPVRADKAVPSTKAPSGMRCMSLSNAAKIFASFDRDLRHMSGKEHLSSQRQA